MGVSSFHVEKIASKRRDQKTAPFITDYTDKETDLHSDLFFGSCGEVGMSGFHYRVHNDQQIAELGRDHVEPGFMIQNLQREIR